MKWLKKSNRIIVLSFLIGLSIFFTGTRYAACEEENETNNTLMTDDYSKNVPPNDALPSVTAKSAIVVEAVTGKVLYARNADALSYPASTTKIMTLIMALEKGNLDEMTRVSSNAADTEGSTVWLEYDERVKVKDLLYGMMLVSGNDAAATIAEHYMGSSSNYAEKMTKRARELGAVHTNFKNVSGLPDPQHYTTARDLALLTAYGYSIPGFEDIVSSKNYMMHREREPYNRDVENENILLWIYDGANGVKTGYTDDAGRCLVSAAKRNGIQLIAVVFDSLYMWNDSIAMLNYGFQKVVSGTVIEKGKKEASIPVYGGNKKKLDLIAADSVVLPQPSEKSEAYKVEYDLPKYVNAEINSGDVVGNAFILYNGKRIASVNLVAAESVERKSLFRLLYSLFV